MSGERDAWKRLNDVLAMDAADIEDLRRDLRALADEVVEEWRLSWTQFTWTDFGPERHELVFTDETTARDRYESMLGYTGEGEPEKSEGTVWDPKLEMRRIIRATPWREVLPEKGTEGE